MPNWCSNNIRVRGSQQREINRLVEAFKAGEFCNAVIPIPEELSNPDTGSYGGEDADAKDRLREELTAKYGYSGWYDFCTGRWGTKWDVDPYDPVEFDPAGVTSGFDSAWSPPTGVYAALVEQGFSVTGFYYEPGMAFAGKWSDEDGDQYWELGGMTSDEVRDMLPEDLDEMMCISLNMEEWEDQSDDVAE